MINYSFLKFFTNVLDQKSFSIYSDMYAISFLLISIMTFGLESAYFRFLYKENQTNRNKIFSSGMLTLIIITLIFLIMSTFFLQKISNFLGYSSHQEYFLIFFLIVSLDSISSLPMAWLRIHTKSVRYACIRILNVSLQAFILFVLLGSSNIAKISFFNFLHFFKAYTDKTGYIFYANMLASILSFVCLLDIIIKIRFKKFHLDIALNMLAYGIPTMLGTLALAINENLDKILIKRWLSYEISGAYAACYKIATFMSLFSTIFRLSIEPFYFRKSNSDDAKSIYNQLTYLFILLSTVFFVLVWSNLKLINYFMLSKHYQCTKNIIPIIMMANIFLGIYTNLSISYKVQDQPIIGTYISLMGALITILSNGLLLIPRIGYIAPAWGTLASYGGMMLIAYWWGQKHYRIHYPIDRILFHLMGGIFIGYYLQDTLQYHNVIGQLLYLCIIFFLEKSILIKLLYE